MPVLRCPNATVSRRDREAVLACILAEQGVLPDAGGWQDQAATFADAYPWIVREVQSWREVAREQAQRRNQHGKR
jgi:hypothetical protein